MSWQRYLLFLAALLASSVVVATYRDIVDSEKDSILQYLSRFVVQLPVAFGLMRRNVWVVRIAYSCGIFFLLVLALAWIAMGPPLAPTQMTFIVAFMLPFACAVFVPRDELLPPRRAIQEKEHRTDPTNPYASPSVTDYP